MKATKIVLGPHSETLFAEFHAHYKTYSVQKAALEDAEQDMKAARADWAAETPEFQDASGEAPVEILSAEAGLLARFSKARAVNDLDKRAYINAVLEAAGVDTANRTAITGMLTSTGLMDEISFSATLAKKAHPEEYAEHNAKTSTGPRTVKFI